MASLTAANSSFSLVIRSVFPTPQQLHGYGVDDAFSVSGIAPAEVAMGVDGVLSAGFIPTPKEMTITLQADSASNTIFDNWYQASEVLKEVIPADAVIIVPGISKMFTCVRGFLTGYSMMPDARRMLQARRYTITWQAIIGAPQL